ncbi:type 1 glutamine amidotransferase [Granulosicoccus sp. 3-233]|uniref:type 1 glutamine amidotransferase n=1 Tax=Granulosicoccus sp. 3-233 TaxID=3417969 RepID=UPI003D33127D
MNATTTMTPSHPTGPGIRLGILQAGRSPEELLEHHQDYNLMFEDLLGKDAFDYRHWPVLDGRFPDSVDDADAWLITGSRFGAYEDHAWIPPLEELIRGIYASGKPMVGICFGHQIIAQALGGKVEKYSGGWSVGRVEYKLDEDVFGTGNVADASSPALLAFHQDQVVELPSDARNVGSSSFCKHAALIYDNRILTLQPHPEFDRDFIEGLLQTRGAILPEAIRTRAEQSLDEPIDREPVALILRRFLSRNHA